eukprot:TRINITY_DN421_c0_g1_i1.p1 TRINITY_DN421_c0_g1~~TRINITY_DN421_c0_g1_i1.p1  ORF type:complete len:615 (-),score=184.56 TRINITY_DN421_c0_g1_i1:273-2117(-)
MADPIRPAFRNQDLFQQCEIRGTRFLKHDKTVYETVFNAVCEHVKEQLLSKKGVVVTGLGRFTYRLEKRDRGTQGTVSTAVPMFVPNEGFMRCHGIRSNQKAFVRNEAPIVEVSVTTISIQLEMKKEVIVACLRQIVDQIGLAMGGGLRIVLDFLFGQLSAESKIMHFHFYRRGGGSIYEHPSLSSSPDWSLVMPSTPSTSRPGTSGSRPSTSRSSRSRGGPRTPLSSGRGGGMELMAPGTPVGGEGAPVSRFGVRTPQRMSDGTGIVTVMPFEDRMTSKKMEGQKADIWIREDSREHEKDSVEHVEENEKDHSGSPPHGEQHRRPEPNVPSKADRLRDVSEGDIALAEEQMRRDMERKFKERGSRDTILGITQKAKTRVAMKSPPRKPRGLSEKLETSSARFLSATPELSSSSHSPKARQRVIADLAMEEAMRRYSEDLERRLISEEIDHEEFKEQVRIAQELEIERREERRLEMLETRKALKRQISDDEKRHREEHKRMYSPDAPVFPRPESYCSRDEVQRQRKKFRDTLDLQTRERELKDKEEKGEEKRFMQEWTRKAQEDIQEDIDREKSKKLETTRLLTAAWAQQRMLQEKEEFVYRHSSPKRRPVPSP